MQGYKVPHFQVVLGGQWEENAGSYGLAIVAIPSKRIPEAMERITELYLSRKEANETFVNFVKRIGKGPIRELLEPLAESIPDHEAEPSFYSDWGDPRQYSLGDIGKGECAGEVVTQYQFEMAGAERMVFAAQLMLDAGSYQTAAVEAYKAMIRAAKALVQLQYDDVSNDPAEVIDEFRDRFYDTKLFFDPFAGPKFADFLFALHDRIKQPFTGDSAHHTIEEATLFVEAVHSCYNRMRAAKT